MPPKLFTLDRYERFALERMADPLNAAGLWFARGQMPRSMEKLVREQLVRCIGEDQQDVGFQITPDGLNYYRVYVKLQGVIHQPPERVQ